MGHGCGWASGAHMTELSANGARPYEAGVLRVSWDSSLTKGAYVLGTLRSYMLSGLALEALNSGRGCGFVRDGDGVVTGTGLHNHFQSSRECNASTAHTWSSSLVTSTPTSLSWHCISAVTFSRSEGG